LVSHAQRTFCADLEQCWRSLQFIAGIKVQDLFAGTGAQIKVPKSDIRLQTSITSLDLVASLWAWMKMPEAPLECNIGIRFLKHGLEFHGKRQMPDCVLACAFWNQTCFVNKELLQNSLELTHKCSRNII
jgi:hypothetical protein